MKERGKKIKKKTGNHIGEKEREKTNKSVDNLKREKKDVVK